jgi:Uncharacterised nucleotidyltransferase
MTDDSQDALREALKRTAVALKDSGVPFALAGGYAAWARGGPEPSHDVDFVVAQEDAEQAKAVLAAAELRVEEPPEDWLFKVFQDDAMVDILYRLAGRAVDHAVLSRATDVEVLSVHMPVLSATDIVASKLAALNEHDCDLSAVLPVVRALREQVDWPRVREGSADNHFAAAALFLVDRLSIADASGPTGD